MNGKNAAGMVIVVMGVAGSGKSTLGKAWPPPKVGTSRGWIARQSRSD